MNSNDVSELLLELDLLESMVRDSGSYDSRRAALNHLFWLKRGLQEKWVALVREEVKAS